MESLRMSLIKGIITKEQEEKATDGGKLLDGYILEEYPKKSQPAWLLVKQALDPVINGVEQMVLYIEDPCPRPLILVDVYTYCQEHGVRLQIRTLDSNEWGDLTIRNTEWF